MPVRCDVAQCGRVHALRAYGTDAGSAVLLCAYHVNDARAGVELVLEDGARVRRVDFDTPMTDLERSATEDEEAAP